MSAAWSFFFNHWATSRQIDKFDRWSGGPAVPHNSIAACLARSRSGLRVACGVVAWAGTWRLSQSRKSSSTIANCGAADRIDVVISNNMELARLERVANDRRSSFAAYIKALAN